MIFIWSKREASKFTNKALGKNNQLLEYNNLLAKVFLTKENDDRIWLKIVWTRGNKR